MQWIQYRLNLKLNNYRIFVTSRHFVDRSTNSVTSFITYGKSRITPLVLMCVNFNTCLRSMSNAKPAAVSGPSNGNRENNRSRRESLKSLESTLTISRTSKRFTDDFLLSFWGINCNFYVRLDAYSEPRCIWHTYNRFISVFRIKMTFEIINRGECFGTSMAQEFYHQMYVFVVRLRNILIFEVFQTCHAFGTIYHAFDKVERFKPFEIFSCYLKRKRKNDREWNKMIETECVMQQNSHPHLTYLIACFRQSVVLRIRMFYEIRTMVE